MAQATARLPEHSDAGQSSFKLAIAQLLREHYRCSAANFFPCKNQSTWLPYCSHVAAQSKWAEDKTQYERRIAALTAESTASCQENQLALPSVTLHFVYR